MIPDGNGWLLQEIKERLPGRTTHETLSGKMTDILLEALRGAAAAPGVHEKELGRPDPDWPQWYAEYMTRALGTASPGLQLDGAHRLTSASVPMLSRPGVKV